MIGLTRRQLDVLTFVRDFIEKSGYSPSYWEIANALNMKSASQAHYLVQALIARGHIKETPIWAHRALSLVERRP